jgi:abortive infection bacteriophage resistance protein
MRYAKPPLPFGDQLAKLEARGLVIPDRQKALQALSHLNYYRLRAYWLGMEQPKGANGEHSFVAGASFDTALALYVFDRELRLLVMDAIEQVEVSVRTQWAHCLAVRYGAHAFLDRSLFYNPNLYDRTLANLQEEIDRSQETFIGHYTATYDDPPLPPIWAVCEVMSFGQLSKWVGNLKNRQDRQAIADAYDLDESTLKSFLHHLTAIRNLCAHHSRLWNRRVTITMRIPAVRPRMARSWFNPAADRQIYNTLTMLSVMLKSIEPSTDWSKRIRALMEQSPAVQPQAMGFPTNWKTLSPWMP